MMPFPYSKEEWMGALVIAFVLGVSVLVASVIEWQAARKAARRRQAERLGFVRRARRRPAPGWQEWDRGL
jgi:predicted lysophospholipase L1 biosynthesis ABC-type transport system permease subunit